MVQPNKTSGVRHRPLRVLIVEDDDDAREILNRFFSKEGFECRSASNAAEAMHLLAKYVPDVIVSDISMPEEDGCGLMRRIRALPDRRASIPAIAVSALGAGHHRQTALDSGFDLYFAKPPELATLIDAAKRLAAAKVTKTAAS